MMYDGGRVDWTAIALAACMGFAVAQIALSGSMIVRLAAALALIVLTAALIVRWVRRAFEQAWERLQAQQR